MPAYSYSLGAKCMSEFTGMTLTMLFGNGMLANEMLPSTKGHGMGYLAVAIGFGLAFGVCIAWFGFISAHLNPAMLFFLALVGRLSWTDFLALSCADFAGAFLGACLVYVFYLPHFGFSLPQTSNGSESAIFVEGFVAMERNAGRLASAFGPASRMPTGTTLMGEMKSFLRLPVDDHFLEGRQSRRGHDSVLLAKMEQKHKRRSHITHTAPSTQLKYFRSNSINVATLMHERDSKDVVPPDDYDALRHSVHVGGLLHTHDKNEFANSPNGATNAVSFESPGEEVVIVAPDNHENNHNIQQDEEDQKLPEPSAQEVKYTEGHEAALQADEHAKLAVFATRPAIFNRPYNFLQEGIATMVLVLGAEMYNLRREMQVEVTGFAFEDGPYVKAIFVSLYIALLVLALGGPTGLAANPARDLGPRLAHQLLPIAGKGPSEWAYGLVAPGLGPMAGAAVGAAIFKGMEVLYNSVEIIELAADGGVEL
jgi:glycerol uptake facilitator-like aquaporin